MSNSLSKSKMDLISIFSDANNILRKDGLSEGKERFVEFANLLFLKILNDIDNDNELKGDKRKLGKKYSWDYYKNKNPDDLKNYIQDTVFKRLANLYNEDDKIIFGSELNITKPANLKLIVDKIDSLGDLTKIDTDIKGDAFEFFLKNSISVGDDLGEYFTPRHIVKLMTKLMNLKFGEKIYDPCCGTGGFLIESFKDLYSKCTHNPSNIRVLKDETIYGCELTNSARIAKMNLILVGDGHNNILKQDCLEHPISKQYDVVLTNFAFSQKTDYGVLYGYTTEDANPIFLAHIFNSLKDDGRAAVVVPEGLLFDTNSECVKIRKEIFDNSKIVAIIKLHEYVFKPYTGQPTSILIFDKSLKSTDNIWFFDVQNDGFKKTGSKKGRTPISLNDIKTLLQIWDTKPITDKSFYVNRDSIIHNNYILSMDSYRPKPQYKTKTVKLKSLLKNKKAILGYTPLRKDENNWIDGTFPWAKITDINSFDMYIEKTSELISRQAIKPEKVLPPNTLLYSFKLSIGKVAITKIPMVTNEAIVGLIVEDPIIRKYLYYILPYLKINANSAAKGKTLNKSMVENLDIPFDKDKVEQIVKKFDIKFSEKKDYYSKICTIDNDIKSYINKIL